MPSTGMWPPGLHHDHVAGLHLREVAGRDAAVRAHFRALRKQIEQLPDGAPPPANRHSFEDFGDQHKNRNQKRGEELADSRRRHKGDGHGEFHGHVPFQQIGNRFFKDGIAADGDTGESQPVDPAYARNHAGPDDEQNQRHQSDARPLGAASRVVVFVFAVLGRRRVGP